MTLLHAVIGGMTVWFAWQIADLAMLELTRDWREYPRAKSMLAYLESAGSKLPPRTDYGAFRDGTCPARCFVEGGSACFPTDDWPE